MLDYNVDEPAHPFRPYGATIGHWLEWARLALHLRAGARRRRSRLAARRRACRCSTPSVREGWAVDGADGFVYTVDWDGQPVVRERMHWVAAEATATAAALHAATGDAVVRRLVRSTWWQHIDACFRDPEHGSWHHELSPANEPSSAHLGGQAGHLPRLPGHADPAPAADPDAGEGTHRSVVARPRLTSWSTSASSIRRTCFSVSTSQTQSQCRATASPGDRPSSSDVPSTDHVAHSSWRSERVRKRPSHANTRDSTSARSPSDLQDTTGPDPATVQHLRRDPVPGLLLVRRESLGPGVDLEHLEAVMGTCPGGRLPPGPADLATEQVREARDEPSRVHAVEQVVADPVRLDRALVQRVGDLRALGDHPEVRPRTLEPACPPLDLLGGVRGQHHIGTGGSAVAQRVGRVGVAREQPGAALAQGPAAFPASSALFRQSSGPRIHGRSDVVGDRLRCSGALPVSTGRVIRLPAETGCR